MGKPAALFTMARSGSTPITRTIGAYLKRHKGITYCGEFFNPYYSRVEDGPEGLKFYEGYGQIEASVGYDSPVLSLLVDHRFKLVKKYLGKIFFNLFPFQSREHFEWIKENHDLIFLERKNVTDHLLSFLISQETGIYYSSQGAAWRPESLVANRESFAAFEKMYDNYLETKRSIQPNKVLYYEDFEKYGALMFLERNGWTNAISAEELKLPKRQNTSPKYQAFKNLSEIERWYRSSRLQPSYSWRIS